MSHHRYTPVDELRSATRFPKEDGTDFAVIWHDQCDEMLVEVHDESLGGLAVVVSEPDLFVVGHEVEIIYAGDFFRARVCHIEPYRANRFVVGFACERVMDTDEDGVRFPPMID